MAGQHVLQCLYLQHNRIVRTAATPCEWIFAVRVVMNWIHGDQSTDGGVVREMAWVDDNILLREVGAVDVQRAEHRACAAGVANRARRVTVAPAR